MKTICLMTMAFVSLVPMAGCSKGGSNDRSSGETAALEATIAALQDRVAALEHVEARPGPPGPQGGGGAPGDVGPLGPQGPQGVPGPRGATGDPGADGAPGPEGPRGEVGAQGPQGVAGPGGATGADGAPGAEGPRGEVGAQGPQGVAGPGGAVGPTGDRGDVGPEGAPGVAGPIGPAGPTGDTGARGDVGLQGPVGATGARGPKGDKGNPGDTGAVGPAGAPGTDGLNGLNGAPGDKGDKGDKGDTGQQGPPGPPADDPTPEVVGRLEFSSPAISVTLYAYELAFGRAVSGSDVREWTAASFDPLKVTVAPTWDQMNAVWRLLAGDFDRTVTLWVPDPAAPSTEVALVTLSKAGLSNISEVVDEATGQPGIELSFVYELITVRGSDGCFAYNLTLGQRWSNGPCGTDALASAAPPDIEVLVRGGAPSASAERAAYWSQQAFRGFSVSSGGIRPAGAPTLSDVEVGLPAPGRLAALAFLAALDDGSQTMTLTRLDGAASLDALSLDDVFFTHFDLKSRVAGGHDLVLRVSPMRLRWTRFDPDDPTASTTLEYDVPTGTFP